MMHFCQSNITEKLSLKKNNQKRKNQQKTRTESFLGQKIKTDGSLNVIDIFFYFSSFFTDNGWKL
jgi:hypothetical protein